METGDIVRFKEGLFKDEKGTKYKIVEINGDRAIVEFVCNLPIPPQSVALVTQLEVVDKENDKTRG